MQTGKYLVIKEFEAHKHAPDIYKHRPSVGQIINVTATQKTHFRFEGSRVSWSIKTREPCLKRLDNE